MNHQRAAAMNLDIKSFSSRARSPSPQNSLPLTIGNKRSYEMYSFYNNDYEGTSLQAESNQSSHDSHPARSSLYEEHSAFSHPEAPLEKTCEHANVEGNELRTGLLSFGPGKRKRFVWSEELHKRFLLCIFEVGLDKAKPKLIFDLMQPAPAQMTSSQIKRHLAKCRGKEDQTRHLFLGNLQASMNQARAEHRAKLSKIGQNGKSVNAAFHVYPFPRGTSWKLPLLETQAEKESTTQYESEQDEEGPQSVN